MLNRSRELALLAAIIRALFAAISSIVAVIAIMNYNSVNDFDGFRVSAWWPLRESQWNDWLFSFNGKEHVFYYKVCYLKIMICSYLIFYDKMQIRQI